MLDRLLHPKSHEYIHFCALFLFTIGIVCSKAFMSIGILLGLLNLLLETNYKIIWENLRNSTAFLLISGLFILHILGMLWTSNIHEGLDDLRMKTSLITVPIIVFSKPDVIRKNKGLFLKILLATICLISIYNLLSYSQLFGPREYTDMRQLSLFGSHIRFSLLVSFGVVLSFFFFDYSKKYHFLLLGIYLIFYTIFSQVFSGLIALFIGLLIYGVSKIQIQQYKLYAWTIISLIISCILFIFVYVSIPIKDPNLPIQSQELSRCWSRVSKLDFHANDKKKQPLESTLIRYMHSKNLSADSIGFQKLSQDDILEIENGTADINEKKPGFIGKLNELRYQIHVAENPNGSTLKQRIEYWKTGIELIKENFFLGVGTGDIKDEFKTKYQKNKSSLLPENRLEAHNTYLTFFITFGIIGGVYLLFFLLNRINFFYKNKNFPALAFILIIASSFITEDTLETQMGLTIFSFLYSIFSIRESNSPF